MQPEHTTLALAPMQGITDRAMRAQFSALGGLDYCVTEFIRVGGRPLTDSMVQRGWPEASNGGRTAEGTPVYPQLLGSHPGRMADAAARLAALGATVIDLNFGCPVRRVNGHDGGAAVLRQPARLEKLIAAIRAAVPPGVSVTAKVRLGWQHPEEVLDIARAVEAGGAALLTVHGRTRNQGYEQSADWASIGRAREAIGIPVVANGDLRSPEDLRRCRELSGCDRFLLGRGAIERPELFRVLRGLQPVFLAWTERLAMVAGFIEQRVQWGERELNALGRLKGWCQALARADGAALPVFESVKWCTSLPAALSAVKRFAGCA
jgi:tRNA-dihydrouridine synthase C